MRRLPLIALAALAIGSGTAAANPLAGHTLSCSVGGTPVFAGCYYEVPLAQLGPLSFSVGVDAQLAAPTSTRESYLAPYVLVTLNLDTWGAWVELAAPGTWGIPTIGRPEAFRAGFTLTFQ